MTEVGPCRGDATRDGRLGKPVSAHGGDPALEVLDVGVGHRPVEELPERRQVAAVRVDGARRAPRGEREQEALDVGVGAGAGHGAQPDSAAERRLLSRAIVVALRPRVAAPVLVVLAVLLVGVLPTRAHASQLIARNTSGERLAVSRDGRALVTYRAAGRVHRVLAWGAVDAKAPSETRPQVAFRLDYSGGWGSSHRAVWKTLRNSCGRYTGPQLPYLVTACTAPDGSYWALQRWQRLRPNFGMAPSRAGQDAWELRLSHWTGPVARLDVWLDWSYGGRFHHLFGRLTYRGQPVYGYTTTTSGDPLDGYGRVLYLDTLDSAYGPGWRRENAFVARRPNGLFCYGFVPHRAPSGLELPAGNGHRYRVSVSGPGVTPDVAWEGPGLESYDASNAADRDLESRMNALQAQLFAGTRGCHP